MECWCLAKETLTRMQQFMDTNILTREEIKMIKKCTIGCLFMIGDAPISWSSKKQDIVALSSCEAEYTAAYLCSMSGTMDWNDVGRTECIWSW